MTVMVMMMMTGRRIRGGDVSEEKGVGPLMRKGTNTCCCPCSRKRALTHSHGEGFGVARITPAPKPLLRVRVTIITVIHSNLNLTCNKEHTRSVRRARHSECHTVNRSYDDTHEMCNTMRRVSQYSATRAMWHLVRYSLVIRGYL
jgi:hypothetical protein